MKINSKLFLSFSIMAVLLGIAGYLAYSQINEVSSSFDVVKNQATPTLIALGNIRSNFYALQAAVVAFNLHVPEAATDPQAKQLANDHLQEVLMQKESLKQSYATYATLGKDKAIVDKFGASIDSLIALTDEMTNRGTLIMNGQVGADPNSDFMHLHELILQFDEEGMAFTDELNMQIEDEQKSLDTTQSNVLSDIQASINLNVLLTVAAVAIVFAVGGFAAYSITRRVKQLKTEANEVASGKLDEQITTPGSDEIADLATNFEHMRKSLVSAQQQLGIKNKELQTLNVDLEMANKELKKLDKLKDQFIGIASHELRGPIHPILGYASMAKDGKISPQVALEVIHKQAVKLKQLASDILDVSKIESETLSYNMKMVKVHEVLLNSLLAASGNINLNQVSIVTKIDEANKGLEIWADEDRIAQVFTNILGNAVKFTKKGSITVETRLNGGEKLTIMITDTGGGIPEDILPNLFGKFVTKNVGDTNKEGTGLGLYISKAIVTAHDGAIEAYNSNGGATFKITLPIRSERIKNPDILAKANRGSS